MSPATATAPPSHARTTTPTTFQAAAPAEAVPPSSLPRPLPPPPLPLATVVPATLGRFLDSRTVRLVPTCRCRLSSVRLYLQWRSRSIRMVLDSVFAHVARRHVRSLFHPPRSSSYTSNPCIGTGCSLILSSSPPDPEACTPQRAHVPQSSHHPRCMRRPHRLIFACTYISGQIPRVYRCMVARVVSCSCAL